MGCPSKKALAVVAAHADKGEGVRGLFDADRNHAAAEIVSKVYHRLAERGIHLVGAAVGNERRSSLSSSKGNSSTLAIAE